MPNDSEYKDRIAELEHELAVKEAELHRYRLELGKMNSVLEKMISQANQDLQLAQILQRHLSPTAFPNIQGFDFSTKFIPGTRSGGDYFDIFEHENKLKFGILISSASGYTLSSALLSVVITMSSQIEARRGLEAHKVIETLAKVVVPTIQNTDQASLFYGIVDRRTFEMQYCSVGNIDVFHQIHGKESLSELLPGAPVLGKGFNTELQSHTVSLNPKDRFIIASEGFKSTTNSMGVQWGGHGLANAISKAPKHGVHELRNEILFLNEQYRGNPDPVRDQTLIVTEVKDRVIKLAKV